MTISVHCVFERMVPIEELRPHPKNPNTHTAKQIKLLARIIQAQGWRAPIVVSNRSGCIVAGHARHLAAQLLQCREVPVDFQDFATDEDELAHLVADNKIAEMAEIDGDILQSLIAEMERGGFDVELAGVVKELEGASAKESAELPAKSVFEVVIECDSEKQQQELFDRLQAEGLPCRLLTL